MNRSKILGWSFALGILLMLPLFFLPDGETDHADLRRAVHVVRHTAAKRQVQRSSFMMMEDKTPTGFVKWMFSPLGSAEWYQTDAMGEFSKEELKMVNKVTPIIPANVAIVPNQITPNGGRQVVVKGDDANQQIVAEAYVSPDSPPVFVEKLKFPKF